MAKKAVNAPKLLVTHSPYNQGKGPNMNVATLPEAKTKDCLEKKITSRKPSSQDQRLSDKSM